jgi:hypothetical protein
VAVGKTADFATRLGHYIEGDSNECQERGLLGHGRGGWVVG